MTMAVGTNFVVKRTFIEVVDEPSISTTHQGLRGRARSDFAVYGDRAESAESTGNETSTATSDPAGLSDVETNPDGESQSLLPCHSFVSEELPLIISSGPTEISECLDEKVSGSGSGTDKVFEPAECSSPEEVSPTLMANLVNENARLALENHQLRQQTCLVGIDTAPTGQPAPLEAAAEALFRMPSAELASTSAPGVWGYPACYAMPAAPLPVPWGKAGLPGMRPEHTAAPPAVTQGLRQSRRQRAARHGEDAAAQAVPAMGGHASPTNVRELMEDTRTTVMLRNLPNNYTRTMVQAMLDREGFLKKYDFLYLPIDFKTRACLGYAFVNLTSPAYTTAFWNTFDGYNRWVLPSKKICGVTWSGPHQGLEAHVERYRNSAIMHPSVPDDCRPVIFRDGRRIPFPAPSKDPRAPRTRRNAEGSGKR